MIPLGLSSADLAAFHATLAANHEIRVTLQLMTLEHVAIGDLSAMLVDGQVNIDSTVSDGCDRSASLTLLDPGHDSGLTSANPDELIALPKLMLRIKYGVRAATSGAAWVDVPIFTGPVLTATPAWPQVEVELQGKEVLVRHCQHGTRTWAAGTLKRQVVSDLLTMSGESATYMQLDTSTATLSAPVTLGQEDDPWALANTLASQMAMSLWYDGRGVALMTKRSTSPVYTFKTGTGGNLLEVPSTVTDALGEGLVNRIRVTGQPAANSTSSTDPVGVAIAPATHPLSPARLGRRGVGQVWTREVDDDKATTATLAASKAQSLLDAEIWRDGIDVELSTLPAPHLEQFDVCRLQTETFGLNFTLRKMSIPLNCAQPASVGALRSVSRR